MSTAVDPVVAALVREVLAEEVARLRAERGAGRARAAGVREERVRVRSDADLARFVERVLAMADDGEARRALAAGEVVFRLEEAGPAAPQPASAPRAVPDPGGPAHTEVVERGLFSEQQAQRLPRETQRLRLGRHVKMTPLARDRLRRRGIRIERMER